MNFNRLWDKVETDLGFNEHNMRRDRPYNGQPHTCTGTRGATEIRGVTFRDLRDCFVRAAFLSAHHQNPAGYAEADKGENATLCENDLYGLRLEDIDAMAWCQNLCCEVERAMGIFPNVPSLSSAARSDPMSSEQVIAPCPFCGNAHVECFGQGRNWWVGCKPCSRSGDSASHVHAKSREAAIDSWNRRPAAEQAVAQGDGESLAQSLERIASCRDGAGYNSDAACLKAAADFIRQLQARNAEQEELVQQRVDDIEILHARLSALLAGVEAKEKEWRALAPTLRASQEAIYGICADDLKAIRESTGATHES